MRPVDPDGAPSAAAKAFALAASIVGIGLCVGSGADPARLGPQPGFLAAWSGIAFGCIFVVTAIFTWRAALTGERRAAALAATFWFIVPVAATNLVTLPGLLSGPASRASATTSALLFVLLRYGLAAGVLAYAAAARRAETMSLHRVSLAGFGLGILAVVAAFVVPLPAMHGWGAARATGPPPWFFVVNLAPIVAFGLALGALLRSRARWDATDLWLAVLIAVESADVLMSAATPRFSVTWYAGRVALAIVTIAFTAAQIVDFARVLAHAQRVTRFAALAEFSPEIMASFSAARACTHVNARWYEVTGQSRADAVGDGWLAVVHPDDRAAVVRAGDGGRPADATFRLRTVRGYRWHAVRYTPADDATGFYAAIADVHEQPSWSFFSADAASAQAARPSLVSYLQGRVGDDVLSGAENVFGELVGNVVRHSPGPIEVTLTWQDAQPVLAVSDRGRGFTWDPTLPADPFAESGRGLFLVATFSSFVDVRPRASGGVTVTVGLASPVAA